MFDMLVWQQVVIAIVAPTFIGGMSFTIVRLFSRRTCGCSASPDKGKSLPFVPGGHKRITVKIVDNRGIESLKGQEVK